MERDVHFRTILGVDFHIEDERGEIVATSKQGEGRKSPIAILSDSQVYRGMKQSFTYRFAPIDPTRPHVFVLDGVTVNESPYASVAFDPGTVHQSPAVLSYENHRW